MRYLTFLSVFCLLIPYTAGAQSPSDYTFAMNKFVKAYNAKDAGAISKLWPADQRKKMEDVYGARQINNWNEKAGKINSCKFVGIDTTNGNKVAVFKSVFSVVGIQATAITLDKKNLFSSLRLIIPASPELKSKFKK